MKPELSEQLFIDQLVTKSIDQKKLDCHARLDLEKLTGDASTRRYYRQRCKEDSYVICLDNPVDEKENSFTAIQKFLHSKDIRVPKIFDQDLSKGYILEEDLGNVTLLKRLSTVTSALDEYNLYEGVIELLMGLHNLELADVKETLVSERFFDEQKLFSEVEFTTKHFLKGYLGVKAKQVISKIESDFKAICQKLASGDMVFTHRDFHSRNLMLKNGELVLIDFQDARMGLPQYDLSSLLDDCYYDLDRSNRYKLIKLYYESRKGSLNQSYDHFLETYEYMAIQRIYKAIGSFSYIFALRGDHRYLKYIGFGMEKLRKKMIKFKELEGLAETLFEIYYDH